VRTAVRYYKNRESLLEVGPEVFLRTLWGNEPKKLKASSRPEPEERDEDDEQSGGEGFGPGLGEPTIFADKGKRGFYTMKQITALLDREFFHSKAITLEAKTQSITELINWLETQKKNLRA
jgi:hypothetical protein